MVSLDYVENALKRIEYLSGINEFKEYISELEAMRPILLKWNKQQEFPNQHLIFAIDPGHGCSTILENFQDYISSSELYQGADEENTQINLSEITFSYSSHLAVPMKEVISELRDEIYSNSPGVIGIHIEDWLDKLDSDYLNEIINYCATLRHESIFVFIVPYVDEEVLAKVQRHINDVLNVRLIHFPPYTDEELIKAAGENLKELDISMDSTAEKCFRKLLLQERSDGRFYGMQSVRKLATELVLLKAKNAAKQKDDSMKEVLTKEDFISILEKDELDAGISGYDRFDLMVGLQEIKKKVEEIVISIKAQKLLGENGPGDNKSCYHMMFTGNPGTGKTEVARIIGKIFRENGLLANGDLLEVSRFDLVGEYIGQTGPKTTALCHSAQGSVLFIDEAYLLAAGYSETDNRDYGAEAIGALIAEMENHRDQFVVILAGYKEEMERLCEINQGLAGRIPHRIHFDNYSKEELYNIFEIMVRGSDKVEEGFFSKAKEYFENLADELILAKEFGNARYVRNLIERIRMKALLRMNEGEAVEAEGLTLLTADLVSALEDKDIGGLNEKKKRSRLGFYM